MKMTLIQTVCNCIRYLLGLILLLIVPRRPLPERNSILQLVEPVRNRVDQIVSAEAGFQTDSLQAGVYYAAARAAQLFLDAVCDDLSLMESRPEELDCFVSVADELESAVRDLFENHLLTAPCASENAGGVDPSDWFSSLSVWDDTGEFILRDADMSLENFYHIELTTAIGVNRRLQELQRAIEMGRASVDIRTNVDPNRHMSPEARLRTSNTYRFIFGAWILSAQELAVTGSTDGIKLAATRDDPFLMTDPVALAHYRSEGTLDRLEQDIRDEVRRGKSWTAEDRQYAAQVAHFERDGTLKRLASYWAISPHPSIYEAAVGGALHIGGHSYGFKVGERIVWACPMTRQQLNRSDPVLIGDFGDASTRLLCGEMKNAMLARRAS